MMSVSAAKLKITLKLAVTPSSLNTLLKNVPVLSEAFWNKPVDRVLQRGAPRSSRVSPRS